MQRMDHEEIQSWRAKQRENTDLMDAGVSSKNIGERTAPELMPTNISSASSDKKLISDWKSSKEVKFPSRVWYVKERESTIVIFALIFKLIIIF